MSVVKMAPQKTGSRNCLAGGVALNSKFNGKIAASGAIDNIFVQAAASDDGVAALGAAIAPYLDDRGKLPNKPMRHDYWGPSFDDEAIEWWRPFAPSFKKEAAPEYLESAYDSRFMIPGQVRPAKRSVIPSLTHVDGRARPQTVEREINPLFYRLIDEFGKITGAPVIMNTSFNLRGEAIVHTPTDALRTFFSSGMDALVVGSFLVEK